jgi:hypothetical protein
MLTIKNEGLEVSESLAENHLSEPPNPGKEFFRIYPNPSTGVFTLDFQTTENSHDATILIYNTMGKRVTEIQVQLEKQHQINLSSQKPGIYLVRVVCAEKTGTIRIIKQ